MLLTVSAFGQGRLGIKGGPNFTNVLPHSETVGSVNGHFGLFYSIRKNDKWSLQPELLVSFNKFHSDDYGHIELTYLVIPVVYKRHVSEDWNIQLGVQYGALMNANYEFYADFSASCLSALVGFGYNAGNRVSLDFRALP